MSELSRKLKISEPAVSLSVKRGMKIAEENQYSLFDDTNLWTEERPSSYTQVTQVTPSLKLLDWDDNEEDYTHVAPAPQLRVLYLPKKSIAFSDKSLYIHCRYNLSHIYLTGG